MNFARDDNDSVFQNYRNVWGSTKERGKENGICKIILAIAKMCWRTEESLVVLRRLTVA